MKTPQLFSLLVCSLLASTAQAEGQKNGEELFSYHGCINCHGAEANNPQSNLVPKLAGKPADELHAQATKIIGGKGESNESRLMHSAFYSPSQCDMPPTDNELRAIVEWISQVPTST